MDMTIIDTPNEALRIARVADIINAHETDASDLIADLHSSMDKDASAPAYLEKDKRRAVRRKKTMAKKLSLFRKAKVSMGGVYLMEKENGDQFVVRNHHSPKFDWNRYGNRIARHAQIPMKELMEADVEVSRSDLLYHKTYVINPSTDFEDMDLADIEPFLKPDFPSFPAFMAEDYEDDDWYDGYSYDWYNYDW